MLTQAEQSVWRAIVDSSPERWLDPAGQLILRRIVAQIAVVEQHEDRLRRIAEAGGDFESEREISREHREMLKSITAGLHALRATPRSRMEAKVARNVFARSPRGGSRPWDIEARATEGTEGGANEAEHGESA
jgi:hypothetical protein